MVRVLWPMIVKLGILMLAKAVDRGTHKAPRAKVVLRKTRDVMPSNVAGADAYAFGSPSHFSIMSEEILTIFTNLYPYRHALAGKPTCVFTTGAGSQVTTLENIDRILDAFNPKWIKPGSAVEGAPKEKDLEQLEN